jgi:hypothetical protein
MWGFLKTDKISENTEKELSLVEKIKLELTETQVKIIESLDLSKKEEEEIYKNK